MGEGQYGNMAIIKIQFGDHQLYCEKEINESPRTMLSELNKQLG